MRSVREKGLIDHTFPRYHTLPHVTMNHTLILSMITVRLSKPRVYSDWSLCR